MSGIFTIYTSLALRLRFTPLRAESIIPIPLFLPGVAAVVIASRFPEARFVFFHQPNAAHPFGALPKIKMGHHHARRTPVFWREGLIVILQCDKGLTVDNVGERHIGGI